ncbi:hypothetical protein PAXRUDRAFT_60163, partial [Paxillus rubicundulus Ve08.2h10]
IRRAAQIYVKHHCSSLHKLTHTFNINPNDIETVQHSCRAPHERPIFRTEIVPSREKAIQAHNTAKMATRVYCDRSGIDGKIGAAAVLYNGNRRP